MNPEPPNRFAPPAVGGMWSKALSGVQPAAGNVLERLGVVYWYPIYAWWRRAGLPAKKAVFATEGCFERWLGSEPPRWEDSGSLSMREWAIRRMEDLAVRGVKLLGAPPIRLDAEWAENRYAREPEGAPDVIFHRRWALTVLEIVVDAVFAEHSEPETAAQLSDLMPFLNSADGGGGTVWRGTVISELRKRYREILRAVIGDTVANPAELVVEIQALRAAVSGVNRPTAAAPAPSRLAGLQPEEWFECAMRREEPVSAELSWVPPDMEEVVRLFPKYEILALIAHGGMGAVYKARQATLARTVAIKLMPLEVSTNREFSERFSQEAKTMAYLSHAHIVAVYEFGKTEEGHLFFVMEFVEGENLHQIIHGGGLKPERALAIFDDVLDALDYAHGKGVVHRDVKPANVIVNGEGRAKVADFGLARLSPPGVQAGGMATGLVIGTPDYMAPERLHNTQVDHRADIYSLGVMLYEMLVREVPGGVFDPPSKRVAVDVRLDAVVLRAMQQARDRRYQTCAEMKTAISAIRAPRPNPVGVKVPQAVARVAPRAPVPMKKPRSPSRLYIGAGAAVAMVLAAFLWPKGQQEGLTEAEKALAARGTSRKAEVKRETTPAPEPKAVTAQEVSDVAMFGGSRFQLVSGAVKWDEARTIAETLGGRLATVTSKEKDDFIRQTFSPALSAQGSFVMLGGYRLKTGSTWQWLGDEQWSYEGWMQGEPSHNGAKAADLPLYLVLSRIPYTKGGGIGWNDKTQSDSARTDFAVKCRGFILESPPDALAARDAAEKEKWKDALSGAALPEGWAFANGTLTHPVAAVSTWQPEAKMRDGALRVVFDWTTPNAIQLGVRNDGESMVRLTFTGTNGTGNIGMKVEKYLINDRSSVLLIPELKIAPQPLAKVPVRIEIRAVGEIVVITANDRVFAVRDPQPKEGLPYLWVRKESAQTFSKVELLNLDASAAVVADNTKPSPPTAPVPASLPMPPPPTVPVAESETVKWLAAADAQWQPMFQRDVTAPFEKAVADLRQQYIATLDKNIAAASQAANLNDALVWRNEKVRIGSQAPHEGPNDPATPAALIQLRDNWRKNFGKVDQARFAQAKVLHARYDALLEQNQKALTQRQRLDDAQLLKTRRDGIARDWLKPALDLTPASAAVAMPAGKLKGREALEFLLAAHWRVVVEEGGKRVPISGPDAMPRGQFEISELNTPEKLVKDAKLPTDEDLAQLAPMRGLKKFELRGAAITGAGLGFLAQAEDLTEVVVESQALTDAVYSAISGNKKVRRLVLKGGKDFALTRLAELPCIPGLHQIEVRGTGSFIPAATLTKAREMQQISVERPAISAEQITAIAAMPALVKLTFNNCQSLPASGWKMMDRSKLEHLHFQNSPLVGIDLAFIGAMRKLESLEIDAADAPQLAKVAGPPALRAISISPSRPGTDSALMAIATAFPRLESIGLGRASEPFTPVGIRALAKLPKLSSVGFTPPKITDEQLAAIAALPALETLRLGGSGISNAQLSILAKIKSLGVLTLNGTQLTADAVEPLKSLKGLRDLDIRDTEIPPAAVAELRKMLPKCNVDR